MTGEVVLVDEKRRFGFARFPGVSGGGSEGDVYFKFSEVVGGVTPKVRDMITADIVKEENTFAINVAIIM